MTSHSPCGGRPWPHPPEGPVKPSPMYEPPMMSSLNRALARISTIYNDISFTRSAVDLISRPQRSSPLRKLPRQPEPREHGVLESGQGTDAIAGEREDEEADSVARAAGVAEVGAEGRLPVRPRRHEVEAAPGVEDGSEESRRRIASLVLERHRRHRDEHVIGEQCDEGPEVGRLVG